MLGNRIKRARKAQGLSLRELGEKLGLSHAAIKKYEDNKVTPSSDVLLKLANTLRVKVEYFFRPELNKLESIQWRKDADMPKTELDIIEANVLDYIERRLELENLFPVPLVQSFFVKKLPDKFETMEAIEIFADHLRAEWSLGLDPIPDLIDVFEEHGIKVYEFDDQLFPKFDGLYSNDNQIPIIVFGGQKPGDRQRFTLAHELGHLFLDNRLASNMDIEKCCNRFSGAFLLPKKSLINLLGEHRNFIEARELSLVKQEFGISMTAILHRLQETGIIHEQLYRELRADFNKRGWSKMEPGLAYPKQKSHIFEQMIFHALAEEYIGESKAAELMNISLLSFRAIRAMESLDVNDNQ